MRFGSVCSGIEAASIAWEPLGWKAAWFAEVDKAASAVLAYRWPEVANHGDMTRLPQMVRRREIEAPDILVGGTPCFPAGTFITTPEGLRPIEEIRPGDKVLTHKGRWRSVLRIGSKMAPTIVLKGQGHPGLTTTAEHPFYACERKRFSSHHNGERVFKKWIEGPTWVDAKNMAGKHWASIVEFPCLPIPAPVCEGNETVTAPVNEDLMWLAGAYVGDGWSRLTERRGYILYGVNASKAALIRERTESLGLNVTQSTSRTGVRLQISTAAIARWMRDNFGHGCDAKSIPQWLLGAPENLRRAFLDGYVAMDGTPIQVGHRIVTVCWKLAVGTRMLANSLGHTSSIGYVEPKRDRCVIEGREVNERPYYTVSVSNSNRSSFERDGLRFGRVRSVDESTISMVFNLEVDEDNTYCADGIVVHNCQSFSVAGMRRGLSDARGNLAITYIDLADAIDEVRREQGKEPCIVVFENVPGLLTSKDNAFGCFLAGLAGEDEPLLPSGKKWTDAGYVLGPERAIAWRVQDAQYHGLAQRRRRVFVVASARQGLDPAAILFEFDGVRRDSPPSRETGEGVAGTLDARTDGGGFPGTDGACSGHDVPAHRVFGTSGRGQESLAAADSHRDGRRVRQPAGLAFGGGNCSGPVRTATALNANERYDFDSETFVVDVCPTLRAGGNATGGDRPPGTDVDTADSFICVHGTQDPCTSETTAFALGRNSGGENDDVFSSKDYGGDASFDVSPTLRAGGHADSHANAGVPPAVAYSVALRGRDGGGTAELGDDVAGCLRASGGGGDKPHVLTAEVLPFDTTQISSPSNYSSPDWGDPCHPLAREPHAPAVCVTGSVTHTLKAEGFDASEDGTGRGQPITVAFQANSRDEVRLMGGDGQISGALAAEPGSRGTTTFLATTMAVRRLMPVERERLQGFPDNHTRIPVRHYAKRKITKTRPAELWEPCAEGGWWLMAADGPRYKQLGNSMATKVMNWLGRRIDAAVADSFDDLLIDEFDELLAA